MSERPVPVKPADLEREGWTVLRGRALSPGFFEGSAQLLDGAAWIPAARSVAPAGDADDQLRRLLDARSTACSQLERVESQLARQGRRSDADIFASHRALLTDPVLDRRVQRHITEREVSAEAALAEVIEALHAEFQTHQSAMIQDKAADILDVGHRWLRCLNPEAEGQFTQGEPSVLVAAALTPSELVSFSHHGPCAAVTHECGPKSHVAILARSLGIPLVSGIAWPPEPVASGDQLFVDGQRGLVLVPPRDASVDRIEAVRTAFDRSPTGVSVPRQPSTLDDVPIRVALNISDPAEGDFVKECGAAGVGLFRTEFVYMGRSQWPTEDESHEIYQQLANVVGDGQLHIRLADFGADKCPDYADFPMGRNPSLGLRGVRLLLERDDILAPQVRAIARVVTNQPLLVLVPMLDGVDTLQALIAALERICARPREQLPFQLGAMIEVPAAALSIEGILDQVDHVSIGLNDLTQYVMAADREEEAVERYHDPLTPAVLNLVDRIIRAAEARGRSLSVCGELAGDPDLTRALIALGVRELSVSRPDYFRVVASIEKISISKLSGLAERIRQARTRSEIRQISGIT